MHFQSGFKHLQGCGGETATLTFQGLCLTDGSFALTMGRGHHRRVYTFFHLSHQYSLCRDIGFGQGKCYFEITNYKY